MSPRPAKRTRLTTTTDEGAGRSEPRERSYRAVSALRPDTVFRLRRIPEKYGKKDIPDLLRTAFQQGSGFPVEVDSLARSPYRADERVATVVLPEARSVLLNIATIGGNGVEWQLEVSFGEQEKFTLHLDTHFQGFTPLHECEEGASTADIIAVSGLNGHAFGSFKQRGGPFMWLRDGLPNDLPNSRIFVYGYDTQLQESSSVQNLTDLGMNLRTALMDLLGKDGKHHSRPLLFIGHSLGGLVIKEAFIHMKDLPFAKILNATHGFIFFGVPNLGMATTSLVPMVGDQPNRGLLETLGRNSALLRRHQNEFRKVFEPKQIQVTSFYETRLSRTACKIGACWKMQGPEELLVEFASATIGSNNYHPIDRDHSDMVKFSSVEDSNYRAALLQIRQLSSDAGFQQENCATSLPTKDLACLRSLAFQDQDWHNDGIESAEGTCDWIFCHETFRDWSQNPRQLLWIRGKPGSGKSTMMKHIFRSLNNQRTDRQVLATFFFNGRGDKSLTTLLALYRALLNQILLYFPEYLSKLTEIYNQKEKAQKGAWNWSVDELYRFFAEMVPAVSAKQHLYILVDALDESGEESALKLITQFEKVLAAAQHTGGVLKICFSCRHYPILTLDAGLSIKMEDHNQDDIEVVVGERLQQFKQEEKRTFEHAILRKSQGVFQWACLATDRVFSLSRRRKPIEYILETIKKTPKELEHLYSSLLLASEPDEDPEERKQILKLFWWMCFAARPLTLAEVQHCLAIDAEMSVKSESEYVNGRHFTRNKDDIAEVVKHISRGLAEFRYNGWDAVLQPIHQTVLDYLLGYGLRELQGSAHVDLLQTGHYYIFKSCVKYLNLEEITTTALSETYPCTRYRLYSKPLLEYSLSFLPYHLHRTTQYDIASGDLLNTLDWPRECFLFGRLAIFRWLSSSFNHCGSAWHQSTWLHHTLWQEIAGANSPVKLAPPEWPQYRSSLLHLAALAGKPEILGLVLERAPKHYLQHKDRAGHTPLDVALRAGQEGFALEILSRIPDVVDRNFVTNPWPAAYLAAAGGMNSVLSIAYAHGMDPNGHDMNPNGHENSDRYTLLSEAVRFGQMSTCRLLLDYGADPNLLDRNRHNALSLAIFCDNEDLCRLFFLMAYLSWELLESSLTQVQVKSIGHWELSPDGSEWSGSSSTRSMIFCTPQKSNMNGVFLISSSLTLSPIGIMELEVNWNPLLELFAVYNSDNKMMKKSIMYYGIDFLEE